MRTGIDVIDVTGEAKEKSDEEKSSAFSYYAFLAIKMKARAHEGLLFNSLCA